MHEGEVAVQRRAGVTRDGIGSAGVGVRLPDVAREFLRQQRMLIVGARDGAGAVWASALYGPEGFVHADGERTIVVDTLPASGDPLAGVLDEGRDIGAIAIEPATRRRMRINGRVRRDGDRLIILADQVFANCPKYIQPRTILRATAGGGAARRTVELSAAQTGVIARANTFFIATHAPGQGADASHRGGSPGFVTVTGPRTLSWPDYRGNSMYMTLGNLALDPACGLLFPDWERGGRSLHLTGRAAIDWDLARAATFAGAERVVDFEIDGVVELAGNQLTWRNT